jgi:hypothetical protein|nr:MAG TPA: hypothetical protein [Caudoviricetes sp.]
MAIKIIEFHNQQYFVGEYYFNKQFDSIVTVSHDGNAVLKATPDISIILGSVDVTSNELENREQLSRRLNTLPVKDKQEDAFFKFETRVDDDELVFTDGEAIFLPVSDDVSVLVESELLAKFNWLTIDATNDHAVRLHKGMPAFYGDRWDSFAEQIRLEFLDGKFTGECSKEFLIEDLIEKAKGKVITEKQGVRLSYLSHCMKPFSTITQRYVCEGTKSEEEITIDDVFAAFDSIEIKNELIYTIMKSVIGVLRRDKKLPVFELNDDDDTLIAWGANTRYSNDVEIRYEKSEDAEVLTFWLHELSISFKFFDNYERVETSLESMANLTPITTFMPFEVPKSYKVFVVFLADALHKLAIKND